jgi:hypothetical protein
VLVVGAVIAFMIANRKTDSHEVGTMAWFLDGLRRDIDVFTRALEKTRTPTPAPSPPPATDTRNPDDLAA